VLAQDLLRIDELWREASHEQDIAKCGTTVADYRAQTD